MHVPGGAQFRSRIRSIPHLLASLYNKVLRMQTLSFLPHVAFVVLFCPSFRFCFSLFRNHLRLINSNAACHEEIRSGSSVRAQILGSGRTSHGFDPVLSFANTRAGHRWRHPDWRQRHLPRINDVRIEAH